MNKKEIIIPFLVIGLTVLFAAICLAVFLSNGKSKKWISRKMKIGGLLLSLTAISTGSGCVSCYDQVRKDIISIDNMDNYEIKLNLDTGNVLTGIIQEITASSYSFSIEDSLYINKQSDKIIPVDGTIDNHEEEIKLVIDENLSAGNYLLKIFIGDISEQENNYPIERLNLSIVND